MWRYSENPVIGRYHIPSSNSIFNLMLWFFLAMALQACFRCDNKGADEYFAGFSKDGINWEINHEPIVDETGQYRDDRIGVQIRPSCGMD